jgi:high-affinity Fe2+/Pb2+ permease
MSSLQKEYSEKGQLDAKSYEALEKVGITKQYVDNYIAGQEAIANQQANEIKQTVGGAESYQEMVDWASKNMTEGEKQAYNKAVNSGDMDTVKLAVNALKGQFERANGIEPKLVSGKAQPTVEQGFESWAQVTEAMADPRYAKDIAYQNQVKNKLANSSL